MRATQIRRFSLAQEPSSLLAKQIWKASMRSVRVDSLWNDFGKRVSAQLPLLAPRDVATIVHSFARIKWRDDKLLSSISPSILKHIDTFTVREIVHILSAFRKLEYTKLDCIDLLLNQLVLQSSDWNAVDVALIANSLGWFRIFDDHVWRSIEKYIVRNSGEFSPLGASLVIGALSKLDIRNERILRRLGNQLVSGQAGGVFKQESFAILLHGFYKLKWDKDFNLNLFFEHQLRDILQSGDEYFDMQSLCMILHSLFCYRLLSESVLTDIQSKILKSGVSQVLNKSKVAKLSVDQYKRLDELCFIGRKWDIPELTVLRKEVLRNLDKDYSKTRGHKLPRWEYEVYRILKDKMHASVSKRVRNGRTDIFVKPSAGGEEVCVLCLGPFQYYANSTKRTATSFLNRELVNRKCIEIPFFIWNELKTDQDKLMFLYSQGRRVEKFGEKLNDTQIERSSDVDDELLAETSPSSNSYDDTDLETALANS